MGIKYLWDTNIVIYYLQQQFSPEAEKLVDKFISESDVAISSITEIELLCWKTESEKDKNILQEFILDSFIFELDQAIKIKTAEIRKIYNVKLPDAIIAATAIVYNLELISRNEKDFKKIEKLKVINPFNQ